MKISEKVKELYNGYEMYLAKYPEKAKSFCILGVVCVVFGIFVNSYFAVGVGIVISAPIIIEWGKTKIR